ncbi:MAG: LPS-assembly protein LptD [Cognatishimia sp.]
MRCKHLLVSLSLAGLLIASPPESHAQQNTPTAQAQQNLILIADSVFLSGGNMLTARGNIEALRGDTRMTATALIYNGQTDLITIEGPIKITQGDTTEIFASFAELDTELQNGLLQSARVVLHQQVELTARQMRRTEGRFSTLEYATATSCKTCDDGRPPLWQIRAKRVRHDQLEKQLYFDQAQFRIFDVPVLYLPRLRLPDPTLKRATGFLIPELRTQSRLGTGVKIPYFIRFGDHRDLTLTPYLSAKTNTLELRYRQAFRKGEVQFEGALSDDDTSALDLRAYGFATGEFDLQRDYTLSFDIKATSDDAYLLEYDYSDLDRLTSEVAIHRTNRIENVRTAFLHFESLRASENNRTLPAFVLSVRKEKRFFPGSIGGEGLWQLEAHSHYRRSNNDTDTDADGIVDGRDVSRVNAELGWRNTWLHASGLEFGLGSNLALDAVTTRQDATLAQSSYTQITPSLAVHLRFPMMRTTDAQVTHILEPIAQIGWHGGSARFGSPDLIANDESTRVEFDEGNLLALSRFPSDDRRERGVIGAWGINWTRLGPNWQGHLTLGQVVRDKAHNDLTSSSGLSGTLSDLLVAGQIKMENGLTFTGRTLLDNNDGINKAEARGSWNNDKLALNASYIWLDQDAAENRAANLSEWNLDTSYRFGRHWTGLANWRYDIAAKTSAEAGLGIQYQNECLNAQFSVSRRFTSSTSVQPSTDLSFIVRILGFSTNASDQSYARTCSQTAG